MMLRIDYIESLIHKGMLLIPDNLGYSGDEINYVSEKLQVVISDELRYFLMRFAYDSVPVYQFYGFGCKGNYCVTSASLLYRQHLQLPYRYLVLSEDDCAAIFLETQDNPEKDSPVHIVDLNDIERFIQGEKLEYGYEYFQSFTDFFQYLIEQEEEYQKEKSAR